MAKKIYQFEVLGVNQSTRADRVSFRPSDDSGGSGLGPALSVTVSPGQAAAQGYVPGRKFTLTLESAEG